MIIGIQPEFYNYIPYKNNKSANINFGAKVTTRRSMLEEHLVKYGSFTAAITAAAAILKNLYGHARESEPILKDRRQLCEIINLPESKINYYIRNGFIDTPKHAHSFDINKEQNKALITQQLGLTVTKAELADLLHVASSTINEYIKSNKLFANEDGLIDLRDRRNLYLCDNFKTHNKVVSSFSQEEIDEMFSKVPASYFIKNGLLKTNKSGEIDYQDADNLKFLNKLRNKEITKKDFFISLTAFATRTGSTNATIAKEVKRGKIVMLEDGTFDVLDPLNAEYLKQNVGSTARVAKRVTIPQMCRILGLVAKNSVKYHIANGDLVQDEDKMINITTEPNKSFIEQRFSGTKTNKKRK